MIKSTKLTKPLPLHRSSSLQNYPTDPKPGMRETIACSSFRVVNIHLNVTVEPSVAQPEPRPCDAHPCGTNAECRQQGQAVSCICPADYIGDPYSACRPECVLNDDCPREQSCVRGKCVDPCPGTCGINAQCQVSNHVPVCTCLTGHTGDPYGTCRPIPVIRKQKCFSNRQTSVYHQEFTQISFEYFELISGN